MTTLLFSHPVCLKHDPGDMHPESPARLASVLAALEAPDFAALERREAPLAEPAQIARVHEASFIDALLDAIPKSGRIGFDPDTVASPKSGEAALRASGALCAAVDAVMAGQANNAFCAVRPPGHHAEPDRAMGFCLFNSVAVGAVHALAAHGLGRVAIVDFDVHHGNGTQAMAWDRANVFFGSSHQMPFYPGTGSASERGSSGNIVNVGLSPGAGSAEFRDAWRHTILPAAVQFKPDLILISAGFDAHEDDPLANINLTDDDYKWVTEEILRVAETCCQGRVVSTLEGGYNLSALARSSAAHVKALLVA